MAGTKEILEAIEAIEGVVDAVQKIFDDGKITLIDARHVPSLVKALRNGFDDLAALKEEVKDLDSEEMQLVLGKVIELVLKIAGKFDFELSAPKEGV